MTSRRTLRRYERALGWELKRLDLDAAVMPGKRRKVELVGTGWSVRVDPYKALLVLGNVPAGASHEDKQNALTAVASLAE